MIQVGMYLVRFKSDAGPVFKKEYYKNAYEDLFRRILSLDAEPVLVQNAEETYQGNGTFSVYWTVSIENDQIVYKKHDTPITLGFLYDKARFPFEDMKVLNPKIIRDITGNKYLSYLFAPQYHAETFLIRSELDLCAARLGWDLADRRVAIKELDSNSGSKVYIGEFDDYDSSLEYPVVLQAYVDTSGGIEGYADGMHDMRVGLYNGDVVHGLVRFPGEGSLKSNMQFGGGARGIRVDLLPPELVAIAKELDTRLEQFGDRFYSVDFGYDGKEWKMFELNAYPGLSDWRTDGEEIKGNMQLIAEHLVESAKGVSHG